MKTASELQAIRVNIMDMHREYVRAGMLAEAHLLMILLRRERLSLGFDDGANRVEHLLENLGMKPTYSRNYNVARFYLPKQA